MIPQLYSRLGVGRWGRFQLFALALAVVAAGTSPAADEKKSEDAAVKQADPLKGTQRISPEKTGQDASQVMAKMTKPRTDSWADWQAPLEPLHRCGEPRALPPCVPPPPCHPSMPPVPYDLVGVQGVPSGGPIYEGPCRPRTGTHDDCPHPHLHRLYDRFFDAFYMWK